MATVDLVSLHKAYGGVAVIHDVDLSIAEGEFVALVGPSGCGKSTLLRIIAGLEEATRGDVRLDGRRVNDATPKERGVAMVFQNYALYPHMSVRDNVGLNLRIAGLGRAQVASRVNRAARLLDIADLLDRRPAQLSGGQRQRVAMGRAIVREPSVFLFDEPLSNLDAKLRVQMRSEIKALHAAVRTTSIYVTHDQVEAMTLADRVVVLNKGRIEQQGTPMELYRRPANVFVAGFIGSPAMNLLPAILVGENRSAAAQTAGGALLPLPAVSGARSGQAVLVGVRPEDLVPQGVADVETLSGPVHLVEPVGAQVHVAIRHGEHTVWATLPGQVNLEPGQALNIQAKPSLVHVFDANTGERLSD